MIVNSIGQQTENLSFAASSNDSDSTTTSSSDISLANFSLDHFVEENPTLERVLQGGASPSYSIHEQNEDELYQNKTAAITFVTESKPGVKEIKAVLKLTPTDQQIMTKELLKRTLEKNSPRE